MTLTLKLPPNLEKELAAEAAELRLTLPEYAFRVLASGRAAGAPVRTGAELVAYWEKEGLFGSRPDITDPEKFARELRVEAERRSRD